MYARSAGRCRTAARLGGRPRGSQPSVPAESRANDPRVKDRSECEPGDRACRLAQPRPKAPAILGEGGPQELVAGCERPPVRRRVLDDCPCADDCRLPPALGRDSRREPAAAVDLCDECLRIGDLRLELDHEGRPAIRSPGKDVDDAALAPDAVRDLRATVQPAVRSSARTVSASAACRPATIRSRSPPRQRGTRSRRTSRAAATRRSVRTCSASRCPRSRREILAGETRARAERSCRRQPRRWRRARIVAPSRRSSMRAECAVPGSTPGDPRRIGRSTGAYPTARAPPCSRSPRPPPAACGLPGRQAELGDEGLEQVR